MFTLSHQHLQEISHLPPLMALVDSNVVHDHNTKPFVQLCVDHCCVRTFLEVCKEGPLNVLAHHNGVRLAQLLDFSKEPPSAWKRAARHAGIEGHVEFSEYIFSQCDSDEIRKSVVSGACMGDKVDLVERFAETIADPQFASHLPPFAAQLNAVECMRHLAKSLSPKTWMSAMTAAVQYAHPPLIEVLMDHVPVGWTPPIFWCYRVAERVVGNPGDQRVFDWMFRYITVDDVIDCFPRLPQDKQERLQEAYSAHQRFVLNSAIKTIDGDDGVEHKRKM